MFACSTNGMPSSGRGGARAMPGLRGKYTARRASLQRRPPAASPSELDRRAIIPVREEQAEHEVQQRDRERQEAREREARAPRPLAIRGDARSRDQALDPSAE